MSFIQDFQSPHHDRENPGTSLPDSPLGHPIEDALDEIDRILHQMLMLAELSASDTNVDRESLQKALDRLQSKIDRIADRLDPTES